jgi:glycosyltransferase involved in cell wall biosynthesis
MLTNTYLPNVCGVTRSVVSFSTALRELGHHVLIVAPESDEITAEEPDVVRVPALQKVTSNDIALRLPIPGYLTKTLQEFQPDLVHVHHPFLLGNTGLRIAAMRNLPVVFTYHTMYEHYVHYIASDSVPLERFTIRLATDFANQCDHIIAPSGSVADVLRARGVTSPITNLPTGIDTKFFSSGDRAAGRRHHGIPAEAFVVGHVGRLAPEKNLEFLNPAVIAFLKARPDVHYLVVGDGPSRDEIQTVCAAAGVADRLHLSHGKLEGRELAAAYRAMDVMAFASKSETQGMVLAEAMSAGAPVVALDASGARDIVRDRANGRLVLRENVEDFAAALAWVADLRGARRDGIMKNVALTAHEFSMDECVKRLTRVYRNTRASAVRCHRSPSLAARVGSRVLEEFSIWGRLARASFAAVAGPTWRMEHKAA